jgi:hypothetical protein
LSQKAHCSELSLLSALVTGLGAAQQFKIAIAHLARSCWLRFNICGEDRSMGNPKIAIVAYCLAIGFILAVAFHSPSKMFVTASAPIVTPVQ